MSKIEVKDASGKFERTATPVTGVKVTIANTLVIGYKAVDAVQLVGEP